jgi:phytoene/squalene synthetase
MSERGHFRVPRPEQWAKLPLKLRQRWWRETDYGSKAPNDALIKAIREAAEAHDAPRNPADRTTATKD